MSTHIDFGYHSHLLTAYILAYYKFQIISWKRNLTQFCKLVKCCLVAKYISMNNPIPCMTVANVAKLSLDHALNITLMFETSIDIV